MNAIEIKNLTKSYRARRVLDGVNLEVAEGEFYALMGPNGSGKTTLASIIASVRTPTSGTTLVYGKKPEQAKELIGYVPQENFSSPKLTGKENLLYFAKLLGYSGQQANDLVNDMLEKIGLANDKDKRVSQYSGGMRKKLEVATAFFPGIRILILDEPTTGLDPSARRTFFSLIEEIKDEKTSIFLITHIGADAELASRVGLIDEGKIISEDSPEALKRANVLEDVITVETAKTSEKVANMLRELSNDKRLLETDAGYRIYTMNGDKILAEIVRRLEQSGHRVERIEVAKPALEDVFFKLTERKIREGGS